MTRKLFYLLCMVTIPLLAQQSVTLNGVANQKLILNNLKTVASFQAAGCTNTTAGSALDLPTTNAPTPGCYGTTIRYGTLDFTATGQNAFLHFDLPSDWQSSQPINLVLKWTGSATTGSTTWSAQTVCTTDGTTVPSGTLTLNTAVTATTTNNTTASSTASTTLANVTNTGCSAGSELWVDLTTTVGTPSLLSVRAEISRTVQ